MSQIKPANDPLIGKVLNERYRIVELIGMGKFSVVYKAHHLFMDRTVALKTLRWELVEDPRVIKRFEKEAVVLSKLRHPNIVSVYDCFVHQGGQPFLAMDFLDGISLEELIKSRGPVPSRLVKPIILQASAGLSHAHQNGVLHRDVKPENIVLLPKEKIEERVRLLDFGFALVEGDLSRLTRAGTACGSPAYMSPERWLGKEMDVRSDIYSLGIVMYEAITGQLPFKGTTLPELREQHISVEPPEIDSIKEELKNDVELKRILKTALAKDADHRYASMREFLAHVKRWQPLPDPNEKSYLESIDLREKNGSGAKVKPQSKGPDGAPQSPQPGEGDKAAHALESELRRAETVDCDTKFLISAVVPTAPEEVPEDLKPKEKVVPEIDRRRKSATSALNIIANELGAQLGLPASGEDDCKRESVEESDSSKGTESDKTPFSDNTVKIEKVLPTNPSDRGPVPSESSASRQNTLPAPPALPTSPYSAAKNAEAGAPPPAVPQLSAARPLEPLPSLPRAQNPDGSGEWHPLPGSKSDVDGRHREKPAAGERQAPETISKRGISERLDEALSPKKHHSHQEEETEPSSANEAAHDEKRAARTKHMSPRLSSYLDRQLDTEQPAQAQKLRKWAETKRMTQSLIIPIVIVLTSAISIVAVMAVIESLKKGGGKTAATIQKSAPSRSPAGSAATLPNKDEAPSRKAQQPAGRLQSPPPEVDAPSATRSLTDGSEKASQPDSSAAPKMKSDNSAVNSEAVEKKAQPRRRARVRRTNPSYVEITPRPGRRAYQTY